MPTRPATVPVTASCHPALSGLRNWLQQHRPHHQHDHRDPPQDSVGSVHQFGTSDGEPPSLGGELRRIGLRADCGGLERAFTGDDRRAGSHLVIGGLDQGVRLPGEQCLVDFQALGGDDHTVGGHLITGDQFE